MKPDNPFRGLLDMAEPPRPATRCCDACSGFGKVASIADAYLYRERVTVSPCEPCGGTGRVPA